MSQPRPYLIKLVNKVTDVDVAVLTFLVSVPHVTGYSTKHSLLTGVGNG